MRSKFFSDLLSRQHNTFFIDLVVRMLFFVNEYKNARYHCTNNIILITEKDFILCIVVKDGKLKKQTMKIVTEIRN